MFERRRSCCLNPSQTAYVSHLDICVVILASVLFQPFFGLKRLATVALEVVFVCHVTYETPAKYELQAINW